MSQAINTPEGCKYRENARFLHPSGAPLIDIYQAGAERTLAAVAPPLMPVTLSALPALHHTTRAVTGNALPRLKSQAGVTDRTLGTTLHGPQWNAEQLRRAIHPGRALHYEGEIHHLMSNVHHHLSRWASKPAIGACCYRATRVFIVAGRGNRNRAVTSLRRNT